MELTKPRRAMEYFAGLFDAEGWISLCKDGHFTIGTEMANEEIPLLFQEKFGGKIYERKRKKRKKTWSWLISTNREPAINFLNQISQYSIIKQPQLLLLKNYLEDSQLGRRENRDQISHQISVLKNPPLFTKSELDVPTNTIPTNEFWKWLAGFLDGDGNLCVYEYQGQRSKIFDSWIGFFNSHAQALLYIKRRLNGSITSVKGCKHPVWRIVLCQKDSEFACESLMPYLIVKKEQCRLLIEFLNIKKTKIREQSYSFDQVNQIREIINQIKHLNSL